MHSDEFRSSNSACSTRLIVLTDAEAEVSPEAEGDGTRTRAGTRKGPATRNAIHSLLVSSRALRMASADQRRRAAQAVETAQMLLRRGRMLHARLREHETQPDPP
jgi:hypothetical protein